MPRRASSSRRQATSETLGERVGDHRVRCSSARPRPRNSTEARATARLVHSRSVAASVHAMASTRSASASRPDLSSDWPSRWAASTPPPAFHPARASSGGEVVVLAAERRGGGQHHGLGADRPAAVEPPDGDAQHVRGPVARDPVSGVGQGPAQPRAAQRRQVGPHRLAVERMGQAHLEVVLIVESGAGGLDDAPALQPLDDLDRHEAAEERQLERVAQRHQLERFELVGGQAGEALADEVLQPGEPSSGPSRRHSPNRSVSAPDSRPPSISSRRNSALPPLVVMSVCIVTPSSGPPRAIVARARTSVSASGSRSTRTMRWCCQISAAVTSVWSRRTVSTTNTLPTDDEVVEERDRGVVELLGVVDHQDEPPVGPPVVDGPRRVPQQGGGGVDRQVELGQQGSQGGERDARGAPGRPHRRAGQAPSGRQLERVGGEAGLAHSGRADQRRRPRIRDRRSMLRSGPARRHGRAGAMRFQPRREE